jgi:LytR cell envelope-related transcriptional attenuator
MSFLLSFVLWAVPWVVVACLVGFGVWAAVKTVGGNEVAVESPSPRRSPSPKRSPTPPDPTPVPDATVDDESALTAEQPDRKTDGAGLHPRGVTVQVINGTGGIEGAAEAMADRLARLGYTIEAFTTGLAANQSVVYFSNQESSKEAVALASYLGFVAEPAPPDLTPEIDLHVVVASADA